MDGIWLHMILLENNTVIHLLCLCAYADAVAAADDNNGGVSDASSTPFKDCKDWTTTILCCVRGQIPPR